MDDLVERCYNVQQGTEEWKELRNNFVLNSSEIGAAVGVDPFTSRYRLWKDKKGKTEKLETKSAINPACAWGNEKEPVARMEMTDFWFVDNPRLSLTHPGIAVYRKDTRFAGSPDDILIDKETGKKTLVEYKCPFSGKVYPNVPHRYMLQVQALMQYLDINSAVLYIWTEKESKYWEIERDDKFWNEWLYPEMRKFAELLNREDIPKRLPNGYAKNKEKQIESYFSCCCK